METLSGYRTIISAVLQFAVTIGVLTATEAGVFTEGILSLISLGFLCSTVYFRLKAKIDKNK